MALDYIIGGLQLLSAAVNALALGAFWISPGLRTTANRFAINLLIANIVACLSLTPAFWLNGGLRSQTLVETTAFLEPNDLPLTHQSQLFGMDVGRDNIGGQRFERDIHRHDGLDQTHVTDFQNTYVEIDQDADGNIREYIDQIDVIEESKEPAALPTIKEGSD